PAIITIDPMPASIGSALTRVVETGSCSGRDGGAGTTIGGLSMAAPGFLGREGERRGEGGASVVGADARGGKPRSGLSCGRQVVADSGAHPQIRPIPELG